MEFVRVNSVKLKIILNANDMKALDLCGEDLDGDSPEARGALRVLLERARKETGFDVGHDRIYVCVFPSVDGGCEMFLTRRGRLLPEPGDSEKGYLKKKYRSSHDRKRKEYIAASADSDHICDLCLRMYADGFSGDSSFIVLDDIYYLVFSFEKRLPSFTSKPLNSDFDDDNSRHFGYLSDYADLFFAEKAFLAKLEEHGKLLAAQNAVETLAKAALKPF